MSALGQKRTFWNVRATSALPPKADIRGDYWTCDSSTCSISVRSSLGAHELLTRRGTGHVCKYSSGAGLSTSTPALPVSHASNLIGRQQHGHPVVQLTNSLASVMIIVHDCADVR